MCSRSTPCSACTLEEAGFERRQADAAAELLDRADDSLGGSKPD